MRQGSVPMYVEVTLLFVLAVMTFDILASTSPQPNASWRALRDALVRTAACACAKATFYMEKFSV